MGIVVTFYSYKGGVGRSMALANIGALLASWGKKVLLIDWDLEAPGLQNYFKDVIKEDLSRKEGLINILSWRNQDPDYQVSKIDWNNIIVKVPVRLDEASSATSLHLIMAGRNDSSYISTVRSLDYDKFYDDKDGGEFLEDLREHWIKEYDFVFIDSRTGLTDSSGICSIQMPDILVMLFTATEQGFNGTMEVAKRALSGQDKIIYDRFKLKLLPVPTRFDSTEFKLQQEWLSRFTIGLKEIYAKWVPVFQNEEPDKRISINHRELLELTKLPYIPYFSYGEKLPVIETGTKDPQGLGYAYETIASVLVHKLEGAKMLVENRSEFVRRAKNGQQPYVVEEENLTLKVTPASTTQHQGFTTRQSIPLILGAIIVVMLVWLIYKTLNPPTIDEKKDSLVYALKVNEFISGFRSSDTSNIPKVLELKRSYYANGFEKDTARALEEVKTSINKILRNEIRFSLPLLYQDIAQNKLDPVRYFADSVWQFIEHKRISVATLKTMTGYFNVPGYNNTIENDSIISFSVDSSGYSVKYVEVGNYVATPNSFAYESSRIKVPVSVELNNDFKIVRFSYGEIKKTKDPIPKARIRVDVFTVGEKTTLQLYLSESIFQELRNSNTYLPRRRMMTDSLNNRPGYYVDRNEIRYNTGEEAYAAEIQHFILKSTGQKFALRYIKTMTKDYVSVFIFSSKVYITPARVR
jgi:AAA domain